MAGDFSRKGMKKEKKRKRNIVMEQDPALLHGSGKPGEGNTGTEAQIETGILGKKRKQNLWPQ